MPKPAPIGARGEARQTVEFRHTLAAHHEQLPPVYSTPDMIRLMETAAFHALHPYSEEGEMSVGTHINIEHRAAAGIGTEVIAEAVLQKIDDRFYTLRVTARDAGGRELGRGTVGRAFIHLPTFMGKLAAKNS